MNGRTWLISSGGWHLNGLGQHIVIRQKLPCLTCDLIGISTHVRSPLHTNTHTPPNSGRCVDSNLDNALLLARLFTDPLLLLVDAAMLG